MAYISIMEPAGPVIAIHKGWYQSRNRQTSKTEHLSFRDHHKTRVGRGDSRTRTLRKAATRRPYEFVNVTIPEQTKDAAMRKLVRTHVRNDYLHDRRRNIARSAPLASELPDDLFVQSHSIRKKTTNSESGCLDENNDNNVPESLGQATALGTAEFAIEMQPRMHVLLSRYLTFVGQRVYPGKSLPQPHPLKSPVWFRLSVNDPAMLHGMLYSGAICLALLEGRTESQDSIYHLYQTISVVNKRLEHSTQHIEDSTIGALSCLALGEAITGNKDSWNMHMRGLKRILQIKTGTSLSPILVAKLHRTDIAGAIDYSETPYLDFTRSDGPSIWSRLPEEALQHAEQSIIRILCSCQIHPKLIEIMIDVAHFSQAILSWRSNPSMDVDFKALSEDMYWIEYRLLLFPTTLGGLEERDIEAACRLGALLYMKTLLEEFPHSATGPSLLLKQLQESLGKITIIESLSSLLLWLSLIGAALSKYDMRIWFMGLLEELTINFRIPSFRDHELEMSSVIGLQEVLGSSVERIWVEVTEALRTRVTLLQL